LRRRLQQPSSRTGYYRTRRHSRSSSSRLYDTFNQSESELDH
jgi:hypothetical protein